MADAGPVAARGGLARRRSRASGRGSGSPGSAARRRTSRCCARWSSSGCGWMDAREFQDANAACGLLPGPASTQLAIFCAYRVGGPAGAIVGGLGFILPAVILILPLSVLFLAANPPLWVRGAGAGAGAAVAAVAVQAARGLIGPSFERVRGSRGAGCALGRATSRSALPPRRCSAPTSCSRCWPAGWSSCSSSAASTSPRRSGCCCPGRSRPAGSARWPGRRSRSARSRSAAAS